MWFKLCYRICWRLVHHFGREDIPALPVMFHFPGLLQLTFSQNRVLNKMDHWFHSVQIPF